MHEYLQCTVHQIHIVSLHMREPYMFTATCGAKVRAGLNSCDHSIRNYRVFLPESTYTKKEEDFRSFAIPTWIVFLDAHSSVR